MALKTRSRGIAIDSGDDAIDMYVSNRDIPLITVESLCQEREMEFTLEEAREVAVQLLNMCDELEQGE